MMKKVIFTVIMSAALLGFSLTSSAEVSAAKGKEIFHARGKPKYPGQVIGNCTACHWVQETELRGGDFPGNVGPALLGMKRLTKEQIRQKIWDPNQENPTSIMPAFGKHGMMSKDDIQSLVEYIHTL